jgi:hypothetical protein
METFNGSLALQMGVWQDVMFNVAYVSFLSNPLRAIEITSDAEKNKHECLHGVSATINQTCSRNVLITQEYNMVEPSLPVRGGFQDQIALFMDQQIYSLDYRDNIVMSRSDRRCKQFTAGPASYVLCTRNAQDGAVEAAMIPCPAHLVLKKACGQGASWKEARGFTTSLHASFLNATVSYDRTDGRILSHEITSNPKQTTLNASELLDAMSVLLDTSFITPNTSESNPVLGAPNHFFGRLIAGHTYRITKLMESAPERIVKGTNALQSIIAMTLFYCQDGILGQSVLAQFYNGTPTRDYYTHGTFSERGQDASFALAETRYRIEVGRATLIAYIALGGITLLICIVVLIIGSLLELAKLDAEPTLWPSLDFYTQCKVQDHNGKAVSVHDRVELAWIKDGKKLFKGLKELKVTRRRRGHGPGSSVEPQAQTRLQDL